MIGEYLQQTRISPKKGLQPPIPLVLQHEEEQF